MVSENKTLYLQSSNMFITRFRRYGLEVYSVSPVSVPWDGREKGQKKGTEKTTSDT